MDEDYDPNVHEKDYVSVFNQLQRYNKLNCKVLHLSDVIRITTHDFLNPNREAIQQTFEKFDADGDGVIDMDEFRDMIKNVKNT